MNPQKSRIHSLLKNIYNHIIQFWLQLNKGSYIEFSCIIFLFCLKADMCMETSHSNPEMHMDSAKEKYLLALAAPFLAISHKYLHMFWNKMILQWHFHQFFSLLHEYVCNGTILLAVILFSLEKSKRWALFCCLNATHCLLPKCPI